MERWHEDKLKTSLTELIQKWLEQGHDGIPLVGNSAAECMATAALSVLRGAADLYEYLAQSGELKDDE